MRSRISGTYITENSKSGDHFFCPKHAQTALSLVFLLVASAIPPPSGGAKNCPKHGICKNQCAVHFVGERFYMFLSRFADLFAPASAPLGAPGNSTDKSSSNGWSGAYEGKAVAEGFFPAGRFDQAN